MGIILGILLWILKITGWILLSVLVLLILILCILLFVPIRYKLQAQFGKEMQAHVRITWLWRLVQANVDFQDKKPAIVCRILWIRKKLYPKEIPVPAENNISDSTVPSAQKQEVAESTQTAPDVLKTPVEQEEDLFELEDFFVDSDISEEPEEVKRSFLDTLKNTVQNIRDQIYAFIDKIQSLFQNIETWKNKIERLIYQFQMYPGKSELLQLVKKELLYIVRSIRPRKMNTELRIGFDDPSTTGQIMGIYAVVTTVWGCKGYSLQMEPDFQNKVLEGNVDLKGRIRLYTIVFPAVRIYLNKRVQKLIKDIKKIKEDF